MTGDRIDTDGVRAVYPGWCNVDVHTLCDEVDRLRAENADLAAENTRLMEAARL